jgi:hypothetical protein
VKHESKEKNFIDDRKIKAEYYPEVEQLLKDVWALILFEQQMAYVLISLGSTGATRVFIFDYTIRRAAADVRDGTTVLRGPGKRVHIDQSYRASENRVKYHLPDEADQLLKKRFQIINVSSHHLSSLPVPINDTITHRHCCRFGVLSRPSSEIRSPSRTPIPCPRATLSPLR